MKKIVLIILSALCVSCISTKRIIHDKKYVVGEVKVFQKDRHQMIALFGNKINKLVEDSNINSAIFYASNDKKVSAIKIVYKEPILSAKDFDKRVCNKKEFYGNLDLDMKLLSFDSLSLGQNWIYAIEYQIIDKVHSNTNYYIIESNITKILISAEQDRREAAIGLMDAFTMELMGVKLHLKTNSKY